MMTELDKDGKSASMPSIGRDLSQLVQKIDMLLKHVVNPSEPGTSFHKMDQSLIDTLRSFSAALLVDSPASEAKSIWQLLKWQAENGRLPDGFLAKPEISSQRDYLSVPLSDPPLKILDRIRLSDRQSAWSQIKKLIWKNLPGDRLNVLRFFEEGNAAWPSSP